MSGFDVHALVAALAIIGMVIIISALLSGAIDRTGLPQVAVFICIGAALGPAGLGVFNLTLESPILVVVAILSLTLVLFTDAVALNISEVRAHARLAFRMLGPGTMLCAALTALAAWWLLDVSPAASAILGAALASTDPVLLRGLLKRPDVPAAARQALRLESGLNDAVLLPIVVVAMAFMSQPQINAASLSKLGLGLFVLGPGAGVAIGLIAVAALDLVRKKLGVRRDYESLYSLGVAFSAFAAAEAVHGSGFLAAFTAGLTIAALDVELCDCFIEYGGVTAEMLLLFTFVIFGGSLIWSGFGILDTRLVIFAVFALLIRVPVYLLSLIGSPVDRRGRLLIAWYGPSGLSSLLLVLLPVFAGLAGSERLFAITSLVVLLSVAIHGASPMLLTKMARKREREATQTPDGPTLVPVAQVASTVSVPGADTSVPAAQRPEAPEESLPPVSFRRPLPVRDAAETNSLDVGRQSITLDELDKLVKAGEQVFILDVRTERSIETSDLKAKDAIRLEPDFALARAKELKLPKDAWLIAYCACSNEATSGRVAQDLRQAGWTKSRALIGGWDAWQSAGLPVEKRG
jgi:NhaP-type Na+/H+ or K+/H+ antiporter/rhodanese-related sulfurtransferase